MGAIKRKLQSKAGASMILAMVFLLFALLVGGSALAAASVNSGRLKDQKVNQQTMLDQRSAMLVLADMLGSKNGARLHITVTEVIVSETVDGTSSVLDHTMKFQIRDGDPDKSALEELLYAHVVNSQLAAAGLTQDKAELKNFDFWNCTEDTYVLPGESYRTGNLVITPNLGPDYANTPMNARYQIADGTYDFTISFLEEIDGVMTDVSMVHLSMPTEPIDPTEVIVTEGNITTKTITTVFEWVEPELHKGGVAG